MDLSSRIARVEAEYRACRVCPRDCGIDRLAGVHGYCRLGREARVFHHYVSLSEELEISPTYEILFSGCSHRCAFCSVLGQVERPDTAAASVEELRAAIRRAPGLRTISLVGGEPTVNLLGALELLQGLGTSLPVVWNTNLYFGPVVHEALDGVVSFVIGDIHWGNDACARTLGGPAGYFEAVTHSALRASRYAQVLVRHLLIPGHEACCWAPIAAWAAAQGPGLRLRLLDNYWPNGRSLVRLGQDEAAQARARAVGLGLSLVSG